MTINYRRSRQYLEAFDFKRLFIEELGWSRHTGRARFAPIEVDGERYRLSPIAELGGMAVFVCENQADGAVPSAPQRKKIDKRVSDLAFEHILIFVDAERTQAVWQWIKKETGQSARARQHTYTRGQPGDSLLQKLAGIAFEIDELDAEGQVSIATVVGKVASQFDVDRVTKRFYDEFKGEHEALAKAIKGLDTTPDRAWYALVTLNRLMFIYFIQKKGFLDGDERYLPQRLRQTSEARGADRFYRGFLVPLFFQGFALENDLRPIETQQLIGRVPYLNGGLFMPHRLEVEHGPRIHIPDTSFKRLFAFFDRYAWQLDDRPLRADNEINPDVLGFIFEKYINQKLMGAYYTKEDITGYICRNTILPFLFDKLGRLRYDAVHPFPLRDVEPYIYAAVKQAEYLPTETDREYAARQKRVTQTREVLKTSRVLSINDFITYNLDIERFVQDWLRGLDDPLTLRAFYFECLKKLTVLDPTVGSGAFLFAAMNIVEPLYEICLDKIEQFAADRRVGPKYPEFQAELARVAEHPNRSYFIFKSIIVNNLYGVDLMEEAVEICKLRLFLKLVSQISDAEHIEPLPDIDFNIVPGNTLVGCASPAEVEQAASRSLFNLNLPQRIKEADVALRAFRDLQTQIGISARVLAKAKEDTKAKLAEIEAELNESLRIEYGAKKLEKFVESHRPFHWYVKFNTIMQDGGFDVLVGNPPYVEYSKVKGDYTLLDRFEPYSTNLYSACCFRANEIKQPNGYAGFIVPVSLPSTDRMQPLRDLLLKDSSVHFVSFSTRPSKLFEGAEQRLTIYIQTPSDTPKLFSGGYMKWSTEERRHLFPCVEYVEVRPLQNRHNIWPKIHGRLHQAVFEKMLSRGSLEDSGMLGDGTVLYYKNTGIRYFSTVTLRAPKCWINGVATSSSRETTLEVKRKYRHSVHSALLSTTFFVYWETTSNCRDLNPSDITQFPIPDLEQSFESLKKLSVDVEADYTSKGKIIKLNNKLTGLVELESLTPAVSKPIIDEIDRVLARHYSFTDEELEFIINYDIKYRMGKSSPDEDAD